MSALAETGSDHRPAWWAFLTRLAGLAVAPRASACAIVAGGRPVVQDAIIFWLLQSLALRLPDLFQAGWLAVDLSFSNGLSRIVAVLMDELRTAAWVALPVAGVLYLAVGRDKRNATVALDTGAAASVLYALGWLPFRLLTLDGAIKLPSPRLAWGVEILVLVLTGAFTLYATLAWRGGWRHPSPAPRRWPVVTLATLLLAGVLIDARYIAGHAAALRPIGHGDQAPDFSLPRLDQPGESLRLAELRGKVVVLDFWATWCPPCLALMPTLHALAKENEDKGVAFVGVNADGAGTDESTVREFLAAHPSTYPSVMDDGRVAARYGVLSIPHLVVIDREGRIAKVLSGAITRAALEQAIRQAN